MMKMGEKGASYPDANMFNCETYPGAAVALPGQLIAGGSACCYGLPAICIYLGAPELKPYIACCGCYGTSLLKMTMHKHNLRYPEGPLMEQANDEDCLLAAVCCSPCIGCLVYRELKMREMPSQDAPFFHYLMPAKDTDATAGPSPTPEPTA